MEETGLNPIWWRSGLNLPEFHRCWVWRKRASIIYPISNSSGSRQHSEVKSPHGQHFGCKAHMKVPARLVVLHRFISIPGCARGCCEAKNEIKHTNLQWCKPALTQATLRPKWELSCRTEKPLRSCCCLMYLRSLLNLNPSRLQRSHWVDDSSWCSENQKSEKSWA